MPGSFFLPLISHMFLLLSWLSWASVRRNSPFEAESLQTTNYSHLLHNALLGKKRTHYPSRICAQSLPPSRLTQSPWGRETESLTQRSQSCGKRVFMSALTLTTVMIQQKREKVWLEKHLSDHLIQSRYFTDGETEAWRGTTACPLSGWAETAAALNQCFYPL